MSTSALKEDRKKRRALVLRPSSRAVNAVNVSSRHTQSGVSRRSFSLTAGGSRVLLDKRPDTVRVFNEEDVDVTPQPLYHAEPAGAVQARGCRFFVEELSAGPGSASDHTTATGSITVAFSRSVFGSSRISSQSTIESMNEEIEDTFSKRDVPNNFPDAQVKRDTVKEQVTEDMLNDIIDVFISETDTISLLDLPCTAVSVDARDAEAVQERNKEYADVCKNRAGNDKYTHRSMQTLNGAVKNKHVQSDGVVAVDAATTVTTWDMYDTACSCEQDGAGGRGEDETETAKCPEAAVDVSRGGADRSVSVGSTVSTASAASSLKDVEVFAVTPQTDLQLIMQSERFQYSLLVMERSILGNSFQHELAAYRQLSVLEDGPLKPEVTEDEQRTEDTESRGSPALQQLWAFSCELSRGRRVSCMAWNKKNQDLLAVGYGEFDDVDVKPGLVCCWSLKNPTWPERVVHCDSAVTSLDFSTVNPGRLAVGTHDGTVAVHSVHGRGRGSRVISSSECPNRHSGPVWQLRWTQQELTLTAEEKTEALVSVSADGRISRWFIFNNGLDCIDVMKLKRIHSIKKKAGVKKTESVLSALTPGLCFDFHPTDSSVYLTGTWDGHIHKCSCSNTQQVLETYRKHFCPVNSVAWCPFSADVFLSCSSDWTIQLWKQDRPRPALSFTSAQKPVCDVKWSPKWATVFGAVNEGQLEIWDLNSSILDPVLVQPAAPGVTMTSLLFAPQSHCVLVGDSDGQVTVYQLQGLSVGDSSQVDVLEGLVFSAAST